MGQDLRELFKDHSDSLELDPTELSEDHELRFLDKLDRVFSNVDEQSTVLSVSAKNETLEVTNHHYKKWASIAASTIVSLGLGWYLVKQTTTLQQPSDVVVHIEKQNDDEVVSLANVSPEFKRFEEMSLATINVGLAEVQINDTNRSMVKGYIKQLEHLKKEYQNIQLEFQVNKITPQAVEVLIENLQMQLTLIEQLKQKVKNFNEYSSSKAYQNLKT